MNVGEATNLWRRLYREGIESDSWGQVEEAKESYDRLASNMTQELQESNLRLAREERAMLVNITTALKARSNEILRGIDLGIGVDKMKLLKPVVDAFLTTAIDHLRFPFDLSSATSHPAMSNDYGAGAPGQPMAGAGPGPGPIGGRVEQGSLLPAPEISTRGDRALSITIEKMGFKDATEFIDPFITVTVVNAEGNLVESSQDTPVTSRPKPNYVVFGCTVHIQTMVNQLPRGSAIFFELKHFKPKKKKVSTKAFAFMEYDEIQKTEGDCVLEIYKKPTDLKRKKVSLLSVKPLYLHLDVQKRAS